MQMERIKNLLHIYSHFQTDIENVKQRQWRDFNATLAGQGSLLLLLTRDFEEGHFLFAILSFFLWLRQHHPRGWQADVRPHGAGQKPY